MPGVFTKSALPKLPGAYFNFEAQTKTVIQPSTGSTVCIPLVHDWGPYKTPTLVTSFAEFQQVFGPTATTRGYKAVKQAFQGEGFGGRPGAGAILVHRFGSSSAAKAAKTLQNTTPANAITLTARYEGTFGNNLSVTTQDTAGDSTKNDLIILLNGQEVERFTYADTNITALATAVNDTHTGSDWVVASAVTSGVALSNVTNQSLTAGADGNTPLAGDYTAAQAAVEPHRFSVLAVDDLKPDDSGNSILTSFQVWAATLNRRGKRFISVFGGALDENVSTANTRTGLLNVAVTIDGVSVYPGNDFINTGIGGVEDDDLGTLSTSQLAPRIAGIVAARGEDRSLTSARLGGTTARNFGTEANILSAYDAGTVVLGLDTDPTAPVHIVKGLTTYVGGDSNKPYTIYRNPKFVRTMHGIETELTEWAQSTIIGNISVNDLGRAAVVGEAKKRIKAREDRGVLQSGSKVYIDSDPAASDDDEFIAVAYEVAFGRSVEQILNTVRIA